MFSMNFKHQNNGSGIVEAPQWVENPFFNMPGAMSSILSPVYTWMVSSKPVMLALLSKKLEDQKFKVTLSQLLANLG